MAEERLEEIRAARMQKRSELIKSEQVPYPSEAKRTHTTAQALEGFDDLSNNNAPVTLVGRLVALRSHGGVVFMDLRDGTGTLQLQVTKSEIAPEMFEKISTLDIGDFIEAAGQLIKTQREVPTLLVKEFHLLSKSIRPLPSNWFGLKDKESRYRQREVDFILNEEARNFVALRSMAIGWIRSALTKEGFLEVETPILQPIAGGAAAEPFTTHHEALDLDLYLRIAPELYLKRLLVGGFEKVFEIGRNFRNEGIDREHNPEFTMLEAYWAYGDYEDMMALAENLISTLVEKVSGATNLKHDEETLSFSKPWQRVRFVDIVSKTLEVDILENKDPETYINIFKERHLELPGVRTYRKLIDELYKELVRPTLIQPTILYDYPVEMVPLAKQSATDPRVAEKFQILVAGTELANAYTELNDPVIQRERFEQQLAEREAGDREATDIDEAFLRALEYGMPPATGIGIGIDRLVWLLGNAGTLRDTIAFPLLRPEQSHD